MDTMPETQSVISEGIPGELGDVCNMSNSGRAMMVFAMIRLTEVLHYHV